MELTSLPIPYADLLLLEERVWLLTAAAGIPNYDFRFDAFFPCRHQWQPPEHVTAVARIGAIPHYERVFSSLEEEGVTLLHRPEEYLRASELSHWYPLIEDLTPKSIWTAGCPDAAMIGAQLGWPIFMKGSRQTSHHQRELSIIENTEQFKRALATYATDPILRGQQVVCREYVRLRQVEDPMPNRIPSSFEFRTFWWKGELAGHGRYWWEGKPYNMTEQEAVDGLALAQEATRRLKIPFLVVDIAQAEDGRWLVIECNDGQESGYGGVSPVSLWQRIIDLERHINQ